MLDSGNVTVSGDASLQSEYVSVFRQADTCITRDTCTDRRGHGMEIIRVVGIFLMQVCVLRNPSTNWHDQKMCNDICLGVILTNILGAASSAIVATQHNLKSCL